jgi:hypothetical protein
MGAVMIHCPRTMREIPTGMEMDRIAFSSSPVFFARTYCPFCRCEHEWFAKDAWVCEEPAVMSRPFADTQSQLGQRAE